MLEKDKIIFEKLKTKFIREDRISNRIKFEMCPIMINPQNFEPMTNFSDPNCELCEGTGLIDLNSKPSRCPDCWN